MGKGAYDGYVAKSKDGMGIRGEPTQADRARGAREGFDRDYEGVRTAYETYKRSDEPSSSEISRRMGAASESAIASVQRTGRESDNEMLREKRRGDSPGFADRAPFNTMTGVDKKGDRYK